MINFIDLLKRLNFGESDFWFIKGYDHFKEIQLDSAIDAYRQAIRIVINSF